MATTGKNATIITSPALEMRLAQFGQDMGRMSSLTLKALRPVRRQTIGTNTPYEESLHDCSVYVLGQLLAFATIALLSSWLIQFHGGYALFQDERRYKPSAESYFNLHPAVMAMATVYLLANSLLYLVPATGKHRHSINVVRVVLYAAIVTLTVIGYLATFVHHRRYGLPHLFTIHAWMGAATMAMLAMYGGLLVWYIVWQQHDHQYERRYGVRRGLFRIRMFGVVTLIMATTTSLLGLNQMEVYAGKRPLNLYTSNSIWMANVVGIFLLFYALFMIYLTVRRRIKTQKRQELERKIEMAVARAMANLIASSGSPPPAPLPAAVMKSNPSPAKVKEI